MTGSEYRDGLAAAGGTAPGRCRGQLPLCTAAACCVVARRLVGRLVPVTGNRFQAPHALLPLLPGTRRGSSTWGRTAVWTAVHPSTGRCAGCRGGLGGGPLGAPLAHGCSFRGTWRLPVELRSLYVVCKRQPRRWQLCCAWHRLSRRSGAAAPTAPVLSLSLLAAAVSNAGHRNCGADAGGAGHSIAGPGARSSGGGGSLRPGCRRAVLAADSSRLCVFSPLIVFLVTLCHIIVYMLIHAPGGVTLPQRGLCKVCLIAGSTASWGASCWPPPHPRVPRRAAQIWTPRCSACCDEPPGWHQA